MRKNLFKAHLLFGVVLAALGIRGNLLSTDENSRIIQIDLDKKPAMVEKAIPYGKPVLLELKTAGDPDIVAVYYFSGTKLHKTEASKENGSWTAVVGPFPPGEDLDLRIETSEVLKGERLDTFRKKFANALDQARDAIFEKDSLTEAQFIEEIGKSLDQAVSGSFDAYKDINRQSVKEIVIQAFLKWGIDKIVGLINVRSKIINAENDLRKIYLSFKKQGMLEGQFIQGLPDEKKKIIQSIGESAKNLIAEKPIVEAVEEHIKTLVANKDMPKDKQSVIDSGSENLEILKKLLGERETGQIDIENLIKDVSEQVSRLETIIFSPAFSVSAEVCDIESYAGFDVSQVMFLKGQSGMGTFFMVSPYLFSSVEINEEPRKFLEVVTPTFGINLRSGDLEEIKGGIYFLGVGIRLNRAFRVTGGWVVYKDPAGAAEGEKPPLKGHFSVGIGLNFRDVGDLLKIFRGSSANFDE